VESAPDIRELRRRERAFAHFSEFKGEASVGTWHARIVMNEALGILRQRPRTVQLAGLDASMAAHFARTEPSPEHAAA
jgi:RNA polymerase sigma-70 factor (ECF subfamily)